MTDLVTIESLVKYFDIGPNQRVHAVDVGVPVVVVEALPSDQLDQRQGEPQTRVPGRRLQRRSEREGILEGQESGQ